MGECSSQLSPKAKEADAQLQMLRVLCVPHAQGGSGLKYTYLISYYKTKENQNQKQAQKYFPKEKLEKISGVTFLFSILSLCACVR